MQEFAPYSDLCDFRGLSIRQLVKSYNYAGQFTEVSTNWRGDAEFWQAQQMQVAVEIRRRISRLA